jgi:hypothetical protein
MTNRIADAALDHAVIVARVVGERRACVVASRHEEIARPPGPWDQGQETEGVLSQ